MDMVMLAAKVKKPLRPLWITQDSVLPDIRPLSEAYHPVVLCTASRRVVSGFEMAGYEYIQGAGDDSEGWSHVGRVFVLPGHS